MRAALACVPILALVACATVPAMPDALPLDGPMVPLAGTVEPPRESWGPFTQVCTAGTVERAPPRPAARAAFRSCYRIIARPAPDGAVQLTLYPADHPPERLAISFSRARSAEITGFQTSGTLLQRATPLQRQQIEAKLQNAAAELRRPDARPPLRQGVRWTEQRRQGTGGFEGEAVTTQCEAVGAGSIAGRPVAVVACRGSAVGRLFTQQRDARFDGTMDFTVHVALDTPTGVERAILANVTMRGSITSLKDGATSSDPLLVRGLMRLD